MSQPEIYTVYVRQATAYGLQRSENLTVLSFHVSYDSARDWLLAYGLQLTVMFEELGQSRVCLFEILKQSDGKEKYYLQNRQSKNKNGDQVDRVLQIDDDVPTEMLTTLSSEDDTDMQVTPVKTASSKRFRAPSRYGNLIYTFTHEAYLTALTENNMYSMNGYGDLFARHVMYVSETDGTVVKGSNLMPELQGRLLRRCSSHQ